MKCPYCKQEAEWVENKEIYGKNYGKSYMSYFCRACDAYVGCHQNGHAPLGTMANRNLRDLRKQCHLLFDRWWKSGKITRKGAYQLLEQKTGVKHIAWTNEKECHKIINLIK